MMPDFFFRKSLGLYKLESIIVAFRIFVCMFDFRWKAI